jgi:alpha-D-ribose 1-methylphosphonate 5-triphosphate synthase subunit PhnH
MSTDIALPGFADPVLGAQAAFRAVLGAMAVPGSLHQAGEGLVAPVPLDPATGAVLLTLVDAEAPLALDAAAGQARDWLAFHCGARFGDAGQARFVLALACPDLMALPAGTDEEPETSATVILQVATLGTGARFRLSGPGLREPAELAVNGLPEDFASRWAANRARFPRGVDVILCAGSTLTALPRSVVLADGCGEDA